MNHVQSPAARGFFNSLLGYRMLLSRQGQRRMDDPPLTQSAGVAQRSRMLDDRAEPRHYWLQASAWKPQLLE